MERHRRLVVVKLRYYPGIVPGLRHVGQRSELDAARSLEDAPMGGPHCDGDGLRSTGTEASPLPENASGIGDDNDFAGPDVNHSAAIAQSRDALDGVYGDPFCSTVGSNVLDPIMAVFGHESLGPCNRGCRGYSPPMIRSRPGVAARPTVARRQR